jgi:hypothetical protein
LTAHLVFVDTGEDLIMADDAVTPLNPLITHVEKEELQEPPLDVNVSQRSHNEESFEKMVCN